MSYFVKYEGRTYEVPARNVTEAIQTWAKKELDTFPDGFSCEVEVEENREYTKAASQCIFCGWTEDACFCAPFKTSVKVRVRAKSERVYALAEIL